MERYGKDAWMKTKTKPQTGKYYYTYVLLYTYDLLHIHHDTEIFIYDLKVVFMLKDGILGPQTQYLGADG